MHRLIETLRSEILALAERHGVRDVRVFGSMARDDAGDASDVDLNERVCRGAALVAALMVLVTGAAFAHSKQEVTFPEAGAVLRAPPDVVSMTFDAPMRITLFHLTSETTGVSLELERSDGMRPVTEVQATPPVLPNGRYTVEWRGLSEDGHPMKCSFSFEVEQ